MTDRVFVDTNVLVYRRDSTERVKQPRAKAWVDALWTSRAGRVSHQVLQEYYQTVTRKLRPGLSRVEARDEVRDLLAWQPIVASADLLERAFQLEDDFSLSFWDSLIVAAARQASCKYLLTEDLQDGQEFDGTRVVDPFRHEAREFGL